ncbi:MAG: T9SS type A sorting domain-containing protein [Candidatus Eisenbacteria bacterium]|uniref:T9SS type A sorting domain-containing protein n=1 Tax=Eiseniibacteriota bacterium TaxID=2212470 RepID=A0A956RQA5_UNCEI|nr:T9SS type A sorting domain-containing protein [Candidatus Eisenbacteria bacterium]
MRAMLRLGILSAVLAAAGPGYAQDVVTITEVIDGGSGGLAVDTGGNIYIGDFGPDLGGHGTRVFKVTPDGTVSVFADGFDGASGNDFDSQGNLFQSNINAWRIDKIAPDGTVAPFTNVGIIAPVGIAIDDADTLYVCNCGTHNIRKIAPDGTSSFYVGSPLFACPNGITMDDDHNLYVANFQDGNLIKITPDRTVSLFATIPGNNNGHVSYHNGLLYVVARGANQIYSVTLDGTVRLVAGSGERGNADGSLLEAQFSLPNDVVPDPSGRYLYVNDVVGGMAQNDTAPMVLRRIDLEAVADAPEAPVETGSWPLQIDAVRPNPFGSSVTISFSLTETMPVLATIHDVQGRQVRRVMDQSLDAGAHQLVWSGIDDSDQPVGPGVYFYRFRTPDRTQSGRIQLVR